MHERDLFVNAGFLLILLTFDVNKTIWESVVLFSLGGVSPGWLPGPNPTRF